MKILDPYLPKSHESHSQFGFMEGGALYAYGEWTPSSVFDSPD